MDEYQALADFLMLNGFTILERTEDPTEDFKTLYPPEQLKPYKFYRVRGKGITGGFCTPNPFTSPYLSGALNADNIDCFDKWQKCPVRMMVEGIDRTLLLQVLEFLGSAKGFELSNSFEQHSLFVYHKEGLHVEE